MLPLLVALSLDVPRPAPLVRDPSAAVLLGQKARAKGVKTPAGATVEVSEAAATEEMRALVRWMTPTLRSAAREGEANGGAAQALAEFMAQDPSRPKAPTVAAYWYNAQRPVRRGVPAK